MFPQKGFWKIVIVTVAVFLLIAVFNLPERYYIIYDGAVDYETGVICLSGESNGISIVYMYSAEGDVIGKFAFPDKGTRSQFNRVYSDNGSFKFFYQHQKKLYTVDTDGNIIAEEQLQSNDFWKSKEPWENWSKDGNTYFYECNGVRYEYDNSNYFELKFTSKNREFRIILPDGKVKLLWDSSLRDEEFTPITDVLNDSKHQSTGIEAIEKEAPTETTEAPKPKRVLK